MRTRLLSCVAALLIVLTATAARAQTLPTLGPSWTVTWTPVTTDTSTPPNTITGVTYNLYIDPPAGGPVIGTTAPTVKGLTGTSWKSPSEPPGTHTVWMTAVWQGVESAPAEATPSGGTAPGPFVSLGVRPASVTGLTVQSP